jgi:hypothetical protein
MWIIGCAASVELNRTPSSHIRTLRHRLHDKLTVL